MKEELQNKLYKKYPILFRQKDSPMIETCMCWGICCGDGWYTIIDKACEELTTLAKDEQAIIEFSQVKEKLGGLRLYLDISKNDKINSEICQGNDHNNIFDKAYEITQKYTELSEKTCDICGLEGKLINIGGWLVTRCETHKDT